MAVSSNIIGTLVRAMAAVTLAASLAAAAAAQEWQVHRERPGPTRSGVPLFAPGVRAVTPPAIGYATAPQLGYAVPPQLNYVRPPQIGYGTPPTVTGPPPVRR